MLTDYWVIAQLLAQFCSWILVFIAIINSITLIRRWDENSGDEIQLKLERSGYLISTILRLVLSFQIVSFMLFLVTVNNRLPNIIKGAMCATGTLGINDLGYPLLYLKIFSVFIYLIFLFLHYLDDAEPAYPLSPLKYYFIFPIFMLLSSDFMLLFLYFSNINPDLIATCCSVTFLTQKADTSFMAKGNFLEIAFYIFGISGIILALFLIIFQEKYLIKFLLSISYVLSSTYVLKYFFVKYIYGILAHYCLFVLFLGKYNFVGYLIFGSYYVLIVCILFGLIYYFFKTTIKLNHAVLLQKTRWLALFFLVLSAFIPMWYWINWHGNL